MQDSSIVGRYAEPAGDKLKYMAVEGGQTETLSWTARPVSQFSIYWGSIDGNVPGSASSGNDNILTFWDTPTTKGAKAKEVYSITGAQLIAMGLSTGTGSWLPSTDNRFFTFEDLPQFTSVAMSTNHDAFEFALPGAPFGTDPPAKGDPPPTVGGNPSAIGDPPAVPRTLDLGNGLRRLAARQKVAVSPKLAAAQPDVLRLAEEQLEVGKQMVETGRTRVRRFVTEHDVAQDVTHVDDQGGFDSKRG